MISWILAFIGIAGIAAISMVNQVWEYFNRRKSRKAFLGLALLVISMAAAMLFCSVAGAQDAVSVPFQVIDNHIIVTCQISGSSMPCMIDTGAGTTTVDSSVGHSMLGTITVHGVGSSLAEEGAVTVTFAGETNTVLGIAVPNLKKNNDGVPVIIGEDILTKYRSVTIDYKTKTLILSN